MKKVSQNKDSIVLELTPIELELLRAGMAKELSSRRRVWDKSKPEYVEELLYHSIMKDTSETMMHTVNKSITQYKAWGVLK